MQDKETIFILDAGNTNLKVGVFQDNQLIQCERISYNNFHKYKYLKSKFDPSQQFLCSVLSDTKTKDLFGKETNLTEFNLETKLPISIAYKTFDTLGKDRIANAVEAHHQNPSNNSLVIDLGTCLKFDLIDTTGTYQGGSIAPGIDLRYQSLKLTGQLPLLHQNSDNPIIGKSTMESIHSGIMNGLTFEIEGFIANYSSNYSNLTFFMTGGGLNNFDFRPKNNTFVDENFTIKGLYQIYLFNAH